MENTTVKCGTVQTSEDANAFASGVKGIRVATLVYQCGLANVFGLTITGRRKRLLQGAFTSCEYFAKGLAAAGAQVDVCHCDQAGDIIGLPWVEGAGDMFREGKLFTANATRVAA